MTSCRRWNRVAHTPQCRQPSDIHPNHTPCLPRSASIRLTDRGVPCLLCHNDQHWPNSTLHIHCIVTNDAIIHHWQRLTQEDYELFRPSSVCTTNQLGGRCPVDRDYQFIGQPGVDKQPHQHSSRDGHVADVLHSSGLCVQHPRHC